MKTLFIEAKYKGNVKLDDNFINKLPKNVAIGSSVQYSSFLNSVKKQIEASNRKAYLPKGKLKYPGQIIGCDASVFEKVRNKVDCFVYIGDGRFHPIAIYMRYQKDVYCYNPETKTNYIISRKDVESVLKRKKGMILKFLSSKAIGILVSTKPGQQKLGLAFELQNIAKDKEVYIFLADTIELDSLENFNFIDCWVNSACPRLSEDENMINIEEAINVIKEKG